MTTQPLPQTTPPAQRQPVFEEAFQRSQAFALQLLQDLPELEAVAILPSWSVQQDRLPSGLMVGKNGPLRTPGEMMRMALLLHRTMKEHLDRFLELMGLVDEEANRLATLIEQRHLELNELEQQLCVTRATAPAGPADER